MQKAFTAFTLPPVLHRHMHRPHWQVMPKQDKPACVCSRRLQHSNCCFDLALEDAEMALATHAKAKQTVKYAKQKEASSSCHSKIGLRVCAVGMCGFEPATSNCSGTDHAGKLQKPLWSFA